MDMVTGSQSTASASNDMVTGSELAPFPPPHSISQSDMVTGSELHPDRAEVGTVW
jgi:hypothetical protein